MDTDMYSVFAISLLRERMPFEDALWLWIIFEFFFFENTLAKESVYSLEKNKIYYIRSSGVSIQIRE